MSQKNVKEKGSYNLEEQHLIHQLVKSRLEQNEQLEFETFEDYEIPPRTQFSMLAKPAVTIKYKEFTFSMSCIRLFEGVKHILPITNIKKKRLCIIPLKAEEARSIEWARQKKDGEWSNKTIVSLEYVENWFSMMNWNRECRYKMLGRVANSPRGLVLLFDFEEAIMFSKDKVEYIEPTTGEVKKTYITYYPDQYKGRIGQSYSDYVSSQNQTFYDQFGDMTGNTYSNEDVPKKEGDSDGGEKQ